MKKIILAGAAFAFFAATLTSCGETKDATAETPKETAAETPSEAPTTPPAPTSDAPSFSSEEVNKGIADYKVLISEYSAALAAKDQTKIADITSKIAAWSQNASSWASKLKPEEAQAYGEYITKLNQEYAAAAQAAATK